MNITELKSGLAAHAGLNVHLVLPDGRGVPAHYHITEVGHVAKRFVDCGGTVRAAETCLLQVHFGSARDDGHRLTAAKLAHILDLAKPILPSDELPVEVEYEDGVVSQFPLSGLTPGAGGLGLQLGLKHTDCLAREKCGIASDGDEAGDNVGCCAGAGASATGACC